MTQINFFIYLFCFIYQSQFPFLPLLFSPPSPHPRLREGKVSIGKSTSLSYPLIEAGPSPPPPPYCLAWVRYFSIENWLHKVTSCIRGRSCSHCQWLHKLCKLHHCSLFSRGLVQSCADFPFVSPETVS